jgi:hypothetical protein
VSVANAAGFNNKVSYVAAAITSVLVFLFLVLPQNVWVAEAAEAAMESASPRQIG